MERIDIQKLYDWAGKSSGTLAEELIKFTATLRNNYKIKLFLSDDNVPLPERKKNLTPIINDYSDSFKELINLILEKELLPGIEHLSERFTRLVEHKDGIEFAKIESAFLLNDDELNKIKKVFGAGVKYRVGQEPGLLGGFVLKFSDGRVFNASVKEKLAQMKMEMAG